MRYTTVFLALLCSVLLAACSGGDEPGDAPGLEAGQDTAGGMVTGTTGAPGPGTVGTPGTPAAVEPDTIPPAQGGSAGQ